MNTLAQSTGQSKNELLAQVSSIDKKTVDSLVTKLGKQLDTSKTALLKAELQAIAQKSYSPRLWAKEAKQ